MDFYEMELSAGIIGNIGNIGIIKSIEICIDVFSIYATPCFHSSLFSENIKGQIGLVFFQIFSNFLVKFVLYLQSFH